MKTVDLPPYAPTLMESTRAIGYSIEAAIADIIDNTATPSEEVKRNLSVIIQKISDGSKRTWTYRGKKKLMTILSTCGTV